MKILFESVTAPEASERIFENPWFTVPVLLALVVILGVLLFVYMPRMEEIRSLQRRIDKKDAIIDRMSKGQTQAELEHVADMEQLRGDHAADALAFATKLQKAEEQKKDAEARTEQSEDLRRQIAGAADKLKARAQA